MKVQELKSIRGVLLWSHTNEILNSKLFCIAIGLKSGETTDGTRVTHPFSRLTFKVYGAFPINTLKLFVLLFLVPWTLGDSVDVVDFLEDFFEDGALSCFLTFGEDFDPFSDEEGEDSMN